MIRILIEIETITVQDDRAEDGCKTFATKMEIIGYHENHGEQVSEINYNESVR